MSEQEAIPGTGEARERRPAPESLHGEGHANATRTRECVAMPGMREQEILTPQEILGPVRRVFGGRIALDPCCPVGTNPCAALACYDNADRGDGSELRWVDRSFWNPPYGELRKWMGKAKGEDVLSIGLIPVRSHRMWWRTHIEGASAICWLDPVTFIGFDQSFPAPLCLVYRGPEPRIFSEATAAIGTTTANPFGHAVLAQMDLFA